MSRKRLSIGRPLEPSLYL